ncbi:MAG TPA: lectin-like protein, partial [Polyangiaceae bacterium]|nr:lectin-like protein [Polyangiaceae bacterium]
IALIGANDVATEGEWRRADGVTFWRDGAAVSGNYANWAAGQPSDPNTTAATSEDCLSIVSADGTWNDVSCDAELPYVCEPR